MSFNTGTAYAESDADDEYERDLHESSPIDATDASISPTDSDPPSNEHTPTTYGYRSSADRLPETIISEWTVDEVADFIATIGLQQYSDRFIENEIVGEALVALLHDDLKSMGIASVGHRLTVLKSVYDVKKAQDVPIENDHYVPLSADAEAQYATATLKDIKHLVEQLRLRDERMNLFEQDFRKLAEDFRRLREDMLPALRLAKDAQQPLPNRRGEGRNVVVTPGSYEWVRGPNRNLAVIPVTKYALTYVAPEHRRNDPWLPVLPRRPADPLQPIHLPRGQTPAPDTPSSSNASVEIFKSFRVSLDDPCYKVLPAALKKYQINAPWDQYALYIVYGDQERCLGLEEKPLILFKQLDKEGKKPMFMLRKTNNAQADAAGEAPGSAGLGSAASTRGGYDPPGGII
ncbi:putative protein kinase regulator ste50 [Diaporthe ampelina]|uniref:Mapkkk cascade protein kinase regulator ste50 n=1 Tax=Diaporthe ampelina TaxID=1214573 RepID=A0A0G2FI74_9PEZI|nr:putative protein kinase regulator ste50 [Diaporthe ampelina]